MKCNEYNVIQVDIQTMAKVLSIALCSIPIHNNNVFCLKLFVRFFLLESKQIMDAIVCWVWFGLWCLMVWQYTRAK
jgi:hypothetical protein